jgi:hypothetical protein
LNLDQLRQSPDFTGFLFPSQRQTIAVRAFYTLYFYAPIAERLGRYTLKTALLDEVVRIIDPKEFAKLKEFREEHKKAGPMLEALVRGMKLAGEKTIYAKYYEEESDMKSISSIYFKMKDRLRKKESSLARMRKELQALKEQLADLDAGRTMAKQSDLPKRKSKLTREITKAEKDVERENEELEQYRKDLRDSGNNPLAYALLEKYLPDFWRARSIFQSGKYQKDNGLKLSYEEVRKLETKAIIAKTQAIKDSRLFDLSERDEAPYIGNEKKPNGYEAWHLVGRPSGKLLDIMIAEASASAEREAYKKIKNTNQAKMKNEIQSVGEEGHKNNSVGTSSRAGYKYGKSLAQMFTDTKTMAVRTHLDDFYEIPDDSNSIHMAAAIDPVVAATLGDTVYRSNEARGVRREAISIKEPLRNGDRVELQPWESSVYLTDAGHRQTILDALSGTGDTQAAVRSFYDKKRLTYEMR